MVPPFIWVSIYAEVLTNYIHYLRQTAQEFFLAKVPEYFLCRYDFFERWIVCLKKLVWINELTAWQEFRDIFIVSHFPRIPSAPYDRDQQASLLPRQRWRYGF